MFSLLEEQLSCSSVLLTLLHLWHVLYSLLSCFWQLQWRYSGGAPRHSEDKGMRFEVWQGAVTCICDRCACRKCVRGCVRTSDLLSQEYACLLCAVKLFPHTWLKLQSDSSIQRMLKTCFNKGINWILLSCIHTFTQQHNYSSNICIVNRKG